MSAHVSQTSKEVPLPEFYNRLGVSQSATQDDIKRAYRALALRCHPDRPGGDAAKFKDLTEAHEVLTNPTLRQIYDQRGVKGVKEAQAQGVPQKPKSQPIRVNLAMTLEELFVGVHDKAFPLPRRRLCNTCAGIGTKSPDIKVHDGCPACNGRGHQVVHRRIGPNMMQQMQMQCNQCNGDGQAQIPIDARCQTCEGKRIITTQDSTPINVPRGSPNGYTMTVVGEGEQVHRNMERGDLCLKVQELPHSRFKREHNNLHITQSISLFEALVGGSFQLQHLDGSKLSVQLPSNSVIRPGMVQCIRDAGMPDFRQPWKRGHLLITFDVTFPTADMLSSADIRGLLKQALNPSSKDTSSLPAEVDPTTQVTASFMEKTNMDALSCELENIDIAAEKQKQMQEFSELQQYLQEEAEAQQPQSHQRHHQQHGQPQCTQQ